MCVCLHVGVVGRTLVQHRLVSVFVCLKLFRERTQAREVGNSEHSLAFLRGRGQSQGRGQDLVSSQKKGLFQPRTLTADMGAQHGWGH